MAVTARGPGLPKQRRPGVGMAAAHPSMVAQGPGAAAIQAAPLPPGFGSWQPPRPFDPQEAATNDAATRNAATDEAGFVAEEGQVKHAFGLEDPTNPFSKGALLQQSFERAKAQAVNSSGNQLYSGSLQNALNYARTNNDQNYAALRSQQQSLLDDIAARRVRSGDTLENTKNQSAADAIARAVNTPVDPTTTPPKGSTFGQKFKSKSIKKRRTNYAL